MEKCKEKMVWCADALTSKHLRELRNYTRPPPQVRSVLEAVATLLNMPDTRMPTIRKMLMSNLPERLRAVNLEDITLQQFRKVRKLLVLPDFDEELIRGASPTAAPLAVWCRAIGACLAKCRFGGEGLSSSENIDGLIISPNLSQLEEEELAQVSELTVSRPDVGSITFHGVTDCVDLDIPRLVHLDVGEVLVYPEPGFKPPVGEGLNKCATVTMYQCWPPNGRGHLDDPKAQERYRWKIQLMTEEKRAKFIDYSCSTGIWKFQVEHF